MLESTRRHWIGAAALLANGACVPTRVDAREHGIRGLPRRQEDAIGAVLMDLATTHRVPGLSFAVARDGEIVLTGAIGQADVENDVPATAATLFRTASIGKSLTAVAAMRLVQDGRIDLDAPIQRYCPRFPVKPQGTITTRHLLAHLSGIRHYGGPNEQQELYNTRHYDDVNDALELFANDPLVHAPGAGYTYSTFGYDVLGCVIQGAASQRYTEVMQHLVFEPAGMADTHPDNPRDIIQRRARGYVVEGDALTNCIAVDMSNKLPAGGYVTSAPDLVRFANAFYSDRLISAASRAQMLQDHEVDGGTTGYGFGWGLWLDEVNAYEFHGMRYAWHGGGTPGVGNILFTIPERRFAVAIMTNQESFTRRPTYALRITEIVLGLATAQ